MRIRWRRGWRRTVTVAGLLLGYAFSWLSLTPAEAKTLATSSSAFHRHSSPIQAIAALPGHGVLASGDRAGAIYLWRLVEDSSALGAKLQQEGSGIGTSSALPLPGSVSALAFGDARCNGPDNPSEPDCGLFVAGVSTTGFSYLQVYDWRRQRLLAERQNLHGSVKYLAAAAGGDGVVGCFGETGIHQLSIDYHRRTAERVTTTPIGENCTWVGYAAGNAMRYAADHELRTAAPTGDPASEEVVDSLARTAFAFNSIPDARIDTAVGRSSKIQLYGYRAAKSELSTNTAQANSPRRLLAEIPTTNRYGTQGVEALTWMSDGGQTYLLTVGRYAGPGQSSSVTHQIERWRVPATLSTATARKPRSLRGGNFNELLGLQASAQRILRLDAQWLRAGHPDRRRYVVVQDGGHRLVLARLSNGYTKTAGGQRLPDSFFALEARPYVTAQLRVTSTGEEACLWPSADSTALTFFNDGRIAEAGCTVLRPTSSTTNTMPLHGANDSVLIAPAREPMDFKGTRLQAYVQSANGGSLFVALEVGPEPSIGSPRSELRHYTLRAGRWAMEGEPRFIYKRVLAMALSANDRLAIASEARSAGERTYAVALYGTDSGPAAPPLNVLHFAPNGDKPLQFALCLDTADPDRPLSLFQDNGPQVHIGAPAAAVSGGLKPENGDISPMARIVASSPDPECAAAPATDRMTRYAMTVELPFAMTGEAKLAMVGERAKYYVVNFRRPRMHVLAIGINNYEDARWQLNYAVNDANTFAGLIEDTQHQIYENIDITLLTDAKATRSRILMELAEIQRKAKASDWVVIFFAGHAQADRLYNYYFLPWDYNSAYPHAVHISEHDLATHLRGIKGKKLLVLDTCFAGNLATRTAMRLRGGDSAANGRLPLASVRTYAEKLMALDDGLVLLAASSLDQTAREADRLGHGVFTSTLLDALRKPERFGNRQYPGALSLADIRGWVEEEVVRRSRDRQRPVITGRTDLLRAPFWQVPTTTYAGPKNTKIRAGTAAGVRTQAIGPVLWQGQSAVIKDDQLAAQPLKPSSQKAL